MVRAKITDSAGFKCAPEGHTVITIPCGAIVESPIADWALEMGKASRMFPQKEQAAPENKAEAPVKTKKPRNGAGVPRRGRSDAG